MESNGAFKKELTEKDEQHFGTGRISHGSVVSPTRSVVSFKVGLLHFGTGLGVVAGRWEKEVNLNK